MSFILDALKKLEQKRHQGSVPDLMTVHPSLPPEKEKRHIWPYLVLAALFLNALIMTMWLRPWNAEHENIPVQSYQNQEESSPAAHDISEAVKHSRASNNEEKSKQYANAPNDQHIGDPVVSEAKNRSNNAETSLNSIPEVRPENTVTSRLDLSARELEDLRTKIRQEQSSITPLSSAGTEKTSDPAETDREIPEYGKLSQSVRDELPEIKINAHIYSNDPDSRITNINGSILREGETVTAGLRVEEITLNGIVFDFKGFRFIMRVF